ncbi:hypothetical protein Ndes2526A_g01343 [Nannochloris sp. 'desiccata']
MQLQRSSFSVSTLQYNSVNRQFVISSQRVARCARVHTASSIRAADLTATKQKLKEACRTKKTPPDQVLQYLREVESASKTSSQVQNFPGILNGTWRLVFAVPAPMPVWAYIPVIEDAIIDVTKQTIELRSFLGPATFTFSGTASFISSPENNVYDMNFSFNASEIAIFGKSWKGQREPKQKTYSFFLAEDELAAVNSRATGGKTLMTRHQ